MDIQSLPLHSLKMYPENPREEISPGHPVYESLKKSIQKHECVQPLVWNRRSGFIIGGNQRFRVLKDLGYQEIEVVVVDLSELQEKELNIKLNGISADWDSDKLSEILKDFSEMPDFDLPSLGFAMCEISEILDRHSTVTDDDFDFGAAVESIAEPVTQPGDLIKLGAHRILCGDASERADLVRLFGSEKAALIHTDPPYGCNYLPQNRPDLGLKSKKVSRWAKIRHDDLSEEKYEIWFEKSIADVIDYLEPGASAYIWNGHAKFYLMHQVLKKRGFQVSTVITWAKPSFALSYADFNQQTEFCLYAFLKNGPHKWYGPTNESNLWEIGRDRATELIHPTQKSVAIPARAIRNSSKRGDVVFDGFLGSGSTLIAAESLGRCCFGIEIDPRYCDAIVRRFIALVGKDKVSCDILDRYLAGVQNGK